MMSSEALSLVHTLFERRVATNPDRLAVQHGDRSITYGGLAEDADRLALLLRGRGLGAERIIGICLPRSIDLVVAVVAVIEAGAAYLPLDPSHPHRRIADTLRLAGASLVLTARKQAPALSAEGFEVIAVDEPLPDAPSAPVPVGSVEPGHLAYVVYTSGSTGSPKGVMIENRALASFVAEEHARLALGPDDRVVMVASPGFDASVFEIWVPLTTGASLHVVDADTMLSPEGLRDWLVAERITLLFLTTALAVPLLRLPWPADCALHTLLTGGERLYERPNPKLPFTLVNNYGPTETTVFFTAGEVAPTGDGLPTIGRPLADAVLRVLDEHRRPVPEGTVGELYLGGLGLARGYLGRPDLTEERFVLGPDGERLYRSGDLGRVLTSGDIDFIGRVDDQVKIRGNRVEPGEVKLAIERHQDVTHAYVVARNNTGMKDTHLVGYVVPRDRAAPPASAQLRGFLEEFLPAYLVPKHFVTLPALPINSNGKVDRNALPEPDDDRANVATSYAAPTMKLETQLAELWRQVLRVDRVGLDDSFFDLGGHSLLLSQVHRHITTEMGHELALVELFEYPTVRALSARIERGDAAEPRGEPADDEFARRRRTGRSRIQRARAVRRAGSGEERR